MPAPLLKMLGGHPWIPTHGVLHELEPVVANNLDRHLSMAREWFPHDYVPWSRGRDFGFLGRGGLAPRGLAAGATVAKVAMTVNLLTEDNLPSYHREIATRFSRDGAWGTWVGQWTAEEGRHSIALRDYLVVTRGVDPVALERLRMEHTVAGYDSGDKSAVGGDGLCVVPGAGHAGIAPQHRAAIRLPHRRSTARPDRRRREPAHGVLPQSAWRRHWTSRPTPR